MTEPTVQVPVSQRKAEAAAARLLGWSRSAEASKGLAKDIRTVLDALTIAQGRALLSQPTGGTRD